MLTLEQVRKEAREMGAEVMPRTFWRYVEIGLLPPGRRVPGQGNVLFFQDDTPKRIAQIQTLTQSLGLPIQILQNSLFYLLEDEPWSKTVIRKAPTAADLIVWLAGVMSNMQLFQRSGLDQEDLSALFLRLKRMFGKLGVAETEES